MEDLMFKYNEAAELPMHLEDKWTKQSYVLLHDVLGWPIDNPDMPGFRAMLRKWYKAKGYAFEQRHKGNPNYSEFRVIEKMSFERKMNPDKIANSICDLKELVPSGYGEEVTMGLLNVTDLRRICDSLETKRSALSELPFGTTLPDGRTYDDVCNDYARYKAVYRDIRTNYHSVGNRYVTSESYERINYVRKVLEVFKYYTSQEVNDEMASRITDMVPELATKIVFGMKTSKALRKVLDYFEFFKKCNSKVEYPLGSGRKVAEAEKYYASYSDAINPRVFDRPLVYSVNPMDFETASRAHNWTSCHHPNPWKLDPMVDKNECSSRTLNYDSCYCAGQFSYMLDNCTVITYSVSKLPDDMDEIINVSKTMRNLFHLGKNFIVQGRMYPNDQTDAGNSVDKSEYSQARAFVEKINADALGFPNMWKAPVYNENERHIQRYVTTDGLQYPDYTHYANCNITFVSGESYDGNRLNIGRFPLCIECGRKVTQHGNLFCGSNRDEGCGSNDYECECCGRGIDEDEVYFIDDYPYCDNCSSDCVSCGDRIVNSEATYAQDTHGYVCDYCRDNYYYYCDRCDDLVHENDVIITIEGDHHFCCASCAERDGYTYLNGDWVSEEDVVTCENPRCGELVMSGDEIYAADADARFCCESCATQMGFTVTPDGEWVIE